MAGIIRNSSRRLASQLQQLKTMASFTSARPGEPTPAISDANRGPTGVLEVGPRPPAPPSRHLHAGPAPLWQSHVAVAPASRPPPS
jgi:hypothetical protein